MGQTLTQGESSLWDYNLSHSFFQIFFSRSQLWPHPLTSKCSIVRALWPESAPPDLASNLVWPGYKDTPDWKVPTMPEMEHLQHERGVSYVCLCRKGEIAHQVPTKVILQPAVTVAMCCHLEGDALQGERSVFYANFQNGLYQQITCGQRLYTDVYLSIVVKG